MSIFVFTPGKIKSLATLLLYGIEIREYVLLITNLMKSEPKVENKNNKQAT